MKRSIALTALCLVSATACSGPSKGAVYVPNATLPTASSTNSGPTGLGTPSSTSASSSSSTSQPTTSTPTSSTTTSPSPTFTCHFEEGDAPCSAAEYQANKTAWTQYQAENNGSPTPGARQSTDVPRDANGFALGGPAHPSPPRAATPSGCRTYRGALIAWSDYQNQHRPAGSTNMLPTSGDVQNLFATCHLSYYG